VSFKVSKCKSRRTKRWGSWERVGAFLGNTWVVARLLLLVVILVIDCHWYFPHTSKFYWSEILSYRIHNNFNNNGDDATEFGYVILACKRSFAY